MPVKASKWHSLTGALAEIQVEKERLANQAEQARLAAEQAKRAAEQIAEQSALQARLQEKRQDITQVVKMRFPVLRELALERLENIDNLGRLDYLFEQLLAAPDENFARWLLNPPVA